MALAAISRQLVWQQSMDLITGLALEPLSLANFGLRILLLRLPPGYLQSHLKPKYLLLCPETPWCSQPGPSSVVPPGVGEPVYTSPKLDQHRTQSFTGLGAPRFDPHATPLVISATLGGSVYPPSTWASWT